MEKMYLISFNSTHHAIRMEKLLKDLSLNIMMVPTPREISASCGLSVVFDNKDIEVIKETITKNEVDISGVYEVTRDGGKKEAQKIF